jgi:hypothetical protein
MIVRVNTKIRNEIKTKENQKKEKYKFNKDSLMKEEI